MRTLVLGTATAALAPALALAGEQVVYDVDGQAYAGYYAAPKGDPQGLVLIIHDWDGPGDYEEQRADMLAELGYAAFAVDLSGQGNRPEIVEARRAETCKLDQEREAMRSRILGGLESARERADLPAVVMGYCFGGAATQIYSGAPHGFTEFGSDRYQERADQESRRAFADFLADQFGTT